jgi:hypothetical protein
MKEALEEVALKEEVDSEGMVEVLEDLEEDLEDLEVRLGKIRLG